MKGPKWISVQEIEGSDLGVLKNLELSFSQILDITLQSSLSFDLIGQKLS